VETIASDSKLRTKLMDLWDNNKKQFLVTRKKQWIDTVKDFSNRHITTPDSRS
jgi:hypothetical protein